MDTQLGVFDFTIPKSGLQAFFSAPEFSSKKRTNALMG
jgi:hypothetical protein